MPLSQGQVINNRYRIVRLLGQGGFGAVYRAWDVNLNRSCALKENLDASPTAQVQFEREAMLLANLSHPNLARVTDYFFIQGQGQYLVMDYIEGEDLQALLDRTQGPLPEAQVLEWVSQVCEALDYLHSQTPPVIHRDIKPANIKITPQGRAVLVDFGIAKIFDPQLRTTVGARAVTPGFSPPEQYGQATTDARSDIYALGATLYTLLTGQVPPASVDILSGDAPSPAPAHAINPQLLPQVSQAIEKAMQVNRSERFASALEFKRALTAATQVTPSPQIVAPLSPPAAPSRRRPVVAAIVVVVLLLLVGAAALGGLQLLGSGGKGNGSSGSVTVYPTLTLPPAIQPQGVLKIGLLAPLTGAVPTFGVSTREGAQMAVNEWNAKGGLLAKQIQLIVVDSQCAPDPALNAANQLIDQDQVKFIIGEVCSNASIPVSDIANQKQVLQISPSSTNFAVTMNKDDSVKPYTFRACYTDSFQGQVMARFALSQGYKTAFILFNPDNPYTLGLANTFETTFITQGGQIVGKEVYSEGMKDFSPILTNVARARPDVLWVGDYYSMVNRIGAQAKAMGVTAAMLGGDGWDSPELDLGAVDGGFYSNHFNPADPRPIVQSWVGAYGQIYKDAGGNPKVPDALAALSYDATNMLLAAIQQAGVDDPSRVKDVLAGLTWEGVTGNIAFDNHHNPIKSAVVIAVKGGQKQYLTTVNP
jgi:branched-chain amino acid transport system substrate-binding protein